MKTGIEDCIGDISRLIADGEQELYKDKQEREAEEARQAQEEQNKRDAMRREREAVILGLLPQEVHDFLWDGEPDGEFGSYPNQSYLVVPGLESVKVNTYYPNAGGLYQKAKDSVVALTYCIPNYSVEFSSTGDGKFICENWNVHRTKSLAKALALANRARAQKVQCEAELRAYEAQQEQRQARRVEAAEARLSTEEQLVNLLRAFIQETYCVSE